MCKFLFCKLEYQSLSFIRLHPTNINNCGVIITLKIRDGILGLDVVPFLPGRRVQSSQVCVLMFYFSSFLISDPNYDSFVTSLCFATTIFFLCNKT